MGRRRVSGVSPSAYQWCGGSGARVAAVSGLSRRSTRRPHGVFGIAFTDRLVRVRPGHRTGRGSSSQMAAHRDMASAAPARRMVRRPPSHSARRRRRGAESTRRARARSPDAGPVAGTHRPLRPVGRHRPGPHSHLGPSPRSGFPHFSQRPEPNGDALPTVQNDLLPCQHLRPPADRLRFNSDAWSRGTVISIGSGAVGMLWDRGRTTGQAGPV